MQDRPLDCRQIVLRHTVIEVTSTISLLFLDSIKSVETDERKLGSE